MTTTDARGRIAKLEALLRRVLARGAEPRPTRFLDAQATRDVPDERDDVWDDAPDAEAHATALGGFAPPEPQPPPYEPPAPMELEALTEPVIELRRGAIAPDEMGATDDPSESIERLRAAREVDDLLAESADIPPPSDTDVSRRRSLDDAPQLEISDLDARADADADVDVDVDVDVDDALDEEPAPSSARRPVTAPPQEPGLAELTFGEEKRPPRHAPPPESGKLPAAMALDFDADVTGVREAPRLPATTRELREEAPEPAPRELRPEATRAPVGYNAQVADVVAEAQRFRPATFGELLDATLELG